MKKVIFHFFVIFAFTAIQGCNRETEMVTAPVAPNAITSNIVIPKKSPGKRAILTAQSVPAVHPPEAASMSEAKQIGNTVDFPQEIEALIANDNWLSDFTLTCQNSLWNKLEDLVLKNSPVILCKSAQQAGIRVVATPRYTGFRKSVKDRNWDLLLQSLEQTHKIPDQKSEVSSLKIDAKRLEKGGSISGIYADDYKRLLSDYARIVKLLENFHERIETLAKGYDFKFNVLSRSAIKPRGYLIFTRIEDKAILQLSNTKLLNSSKIDLSDYLKLKTGISPYNEIHYSRTSEGEEISCDLNGLTFISLRPSTTLFESDNGYLSKTPPPLDTADHWFTVTASGQYNSIIRSYTNSKDLTDRALAWAQARDLWRDVPDMKLKEIKAKEQTAIGLITDKKSSGEISPDAYTELIRKSLSSSVNQVKTLLLNM